MISETMRRVRSKDTSPEQALRKALWRSGVRYRLHSKKLPGQPDLTFSSARVAVFVDGDFWHGNQWRRRGFASLEEQFKDAPSAPYWVSKIAGNMQRDAKTNRQLRRIGWRVVRIWESDIRADLLSCVDRVLQAVGPADRRPDRA